MPCQTSAAMATVVRRQAEDAHAPVELCKYAAVITGAITECVRVCLAVCSQQHGLSHLEEATHTQDGFPECELLQLIFLLHGERLAAGLTGLHPALQPQFPFFGPEVIPLHHRLCQPCVRGHPA